MYRMESTTNVIKNKFFLLLLALFIFFLLNPLIGTKIASFFFGIFFTIILLFSILVITHNKWLIIPAVLLGLLVFMGVWWGLIYKPIKIITIIETAIAALFFFVITITVLSSVIKDKTITLNTILGAISGYVLIGLCCSFIFLLIDYIDPHAFNLTYGVPTSIDIHIKNFIYYSYVTLTTIGYGDIVPIEGYARTLS